MNKLLFGIAGCVCLCNSFYACQQEYGDVNAQLHTNISCDENVAGLQRNVQQVSSDDSIVSDNAEKGKYWDSDQKKAEYLSGMIKRCYDAGVSPDAMVAILTRCDFIYDEVIICKDWAALLWYLCYKNMK